MRRGKRLLLRHVRSPTARFKGHGQWRRTASFPRGVPERRTTSSEGGDPFLSIQGLQFGKRRRRAAEETRRVERHEEHVGNRVSLSPRPLVDQPLGTNFGGVCSCTGSPARAAVRLPGQRSPSMCLGRWERRHSRSALNLRSIFPQRNRPTSSNRIGGGCKSREARQRSDREKSRGERSTGTVKGEPESWP